MPQFLIDYGADIAPRDRWGNTPLDDARRENKSAIVDLLGEAMASRREDDVESTSEGALRTSERSESVA